MVEALTGLACGGLAASAILGLVWQTPAIWRGVQLAGLAGTLVLLIAFIIHSVQAAMLPAIFDSGGRALTLALIGLGLAWLPRRPFALDTCWTFGIAAALAGWAEFAPQDSLPLPLALVGLIFLAAGGVTLAAWSRTLAALQTRDRRFPSEGKITLALGLSLLALFVASAQHLLAAGSLWPPMPVFKAIAAAWLGLVAINLLQERPIAQWLTGALALVLIGISIAPGVWSAG